MTALVEDAVPGRGDGSITRVLAPGIAVLEAGHQHGVRRLAAGVLEAERLAAELARLRAAH